MESRPLRIFICAGEESGDLHAAALMAALREALRRPVEFKGFGGGRMKAAGAELMYHVDQTAFIGITPVLMHLPFLLVDCSQLVPVLTLDGVDEVLGLTTLLLGEALGSFGGFIVRSAGA